MYDVRKDVRLRVWAGLFYPESTKKDWQKILTDNMVCCAVSPLHDKDKNEDGTLKKEHYHIVFKFNGSKSFSQVWDILKLIAIDPDHCPPPEKPYTDITRLVQYLIHDNDDNKYQYCRSDILSFGGFDVDRHFRLSSEEEDQIFEFVMDFIIDKDIMEYWDLLVCLRACCTVKENDLYEEAYRFVRKHTMLITHALSSRRNKNRRMNDVSR